jgi:Arc/MetJ-type ribon-helix-helix transcriptional regulator
MPYTLSIEAQRLVDEYLSTGQYSSPDDVVIDALRTLRDKQDDLAAIRAGLEDVKAGRIRPMHEVAEEIRLQLGIEKSA